MTCILSIIIEHPRIHHMGYKKKSSHDGTIAVFISSQRTNKYPPPYVTIFPLILSFNTISRTFLIYSFIHSNPNNSNIFYWISLSMCNFGSTSFPPEFNFLLQIPSCPQFSNFYSLGSAWGTKLSARGSLSYSICTPTFPPRLSTE